jgi:hypothetical protein
MHHASNGRVVSKVLISAWYIAVYVVLSRTAPRIMSYRAPTKRRYVNSWRDVCETSALTPSRNISIRHRRVFGVRSFNTPMLELRPRGLVGENVRFVRRVLSRSDQMLTLRLVSVNRPTGQFLYRDTTLVYRVYKPVIATSICPYRSSQACVRKCRIACRVGDACPIVWPF